MYKTIRAGDTVKLLPMDKVNTDRGGGYFKYMEGLLGKRLVVESSSDNLRFTENVLFNKISLTASELQHKVERTGSDDVSWHHSWFVKVNPERTGLMKLL